MANRGLTTPEVSIMSGLLRVFLLLPQPVLIVELALQEAARVIGDAPQPLRLRLFILVPLRRFRRLGGGLVALPGGRFLPGRF